MQLAGEHLNLVMRICFDGAGDGDGQAVPDDFSGGVEVGEHPDPPAAGAGEEPFLHGACEGGRETVAIEVLRAVLAE